MSTLPRVDIINVNFLDRTGERLFTGGAERYIRDLALLCARMGFTPRIVQNANAPWQRQVQGLDVIGVPAAPVVEFGQISRGFAAVIADAALIIASPVDLACSLPPGPPLLGVNHGIWWDDPATPHGGQSGTMERISTALTRAHAVVGVDTNFINWLRAGRIWRTDHVHYVPNYVSRDRFGVGDDKDFTGRLRVLFPRRLCAERGFATLLAAFDQLFAQRDDIELVVCGDGGETETQAMCDFVGRWPGRATLTSRAMDAMPEMFAASHVVVIPTVYSEGTSLACLEAMAGNNAVIATHVGGLANLVIDGYNGLLIDVGSAPLQHAVARLADDRALVTRLARRAQDMSAAFGHARWERAWHGLIVDAVDAGIRQRLVTLDMRDIDAVLVRGDDAAWLPRVERDRTVSSLATEVDVLRETLAARATRMAGLQARHDAAVAETDVARRRMDELAVARDNAVTALAPSRRERGQLRDENARLRSRGNTIATELRAAVAHCERLYDTIAERDQALAAAQQLAAETTHAIRLLEADRDAVRAAHQARRHSFKMIAVDGLYELLDRVPALHRMIRVAIPPALRERVNRRSYANTAVQADTVAIPLPARVIALPPVLHKPTFNLAIPLLDPTPSGQDEPAPDALAHALYPIFCFAIIDWDFRYQRPQQLLARLAAAGHHVYYVVASSGPPAGEAYSLRSVAPNVFEVRLACDAQQSHYAEAISPANLAAMQQSLARLVSDEQLSYAISLVHLPFWAPLAFALRDARQWAVVYDCMDEWEDFPNIGQPLLAQERRLVREADLVTTSGSILADKQGAHARHCVLVRNATDFEYFAAACLPNDELAGVARPIIGYYGALAEWFDFELVAAVAKLRPDWTFVLVGHVHVDDIAGLDRIANVVMLGERPYRDMPKLLYQFDVCLIPFKLNKVTHAVDPVKFYEYLSAGKPVVTVALDELKVNAEYAYFATTPDDFVSQIGVALAENDPAVWNARIAFAARNDWGSRAGAMIEAIDTVHPRVSIVIVSYENVQLTRDCVESIYRNTAWPNLEIIVVDNGSQDGSRTWLRYLSRVRADATVILNEDNRGFAAANNQGLQIATGEFLVMLNNDTIVPPGWLEPLLRQLRDPAIGMVGPVSNFVGNEARIDVDYADVADMPAFAAAWMDDHRDDAFDIHVLGMFCVAFTRNTYDRIGPLDEVFGIGMFEDDDYSRRVQQAGLRTVCTPASFVHHFGQSAFKKLMPSGDYDRLWQRNQALYEAKWGKWVPHEGTRRAAP